MDISIIRRSWKSSPLVVLLRRSFKVSLAVGSHRRLLQVVCGTISSFPSFGRISQRVVLRGFMPFPLDPVCPCTQTQRKSASTSVSKCPYLTKTNSSARNQNIKSASSNLQVIFRSFPRTLERPHQQQLRPWTQGHSWTGSAPNRAEL